MSRDVIPGGKGEFEVFFKNLVDYVGEKCG
jgi:hypothetical protein